jgi:regulator of replication initiation timing
MPIKATMTADEFGELDETLQADYKKQEDGSYKLSLLDGFESADDVTGLKSALRKERENSRAANSELSKLRDQFGDIDVEEYSALKQAAADAEREKLEKKGEYDSLLKQHAEKFDGERLKFGERESFLKSVIEKLTIDNAALAALSELGGNTELLLPHVKARVQMVEENGAFEARVMDAEGNPRVGKETTFMSVRELVGEMREQETFASAFKTDAKPGGGTPPGGGGDKKPGGGVIPKDLKRSDMTIRQKADFIKEHGEAELLKLPA